MVKPPLRRKSIGFKVSEEEYAQLETAAQTSGRTLGEWCREVVLARETEARKNQRREEVILPFFCWRVYGAREPSQGSALRSDERAKPARP